MFEEIDSADLNAALSKANVGGLMTWADNCRIDREAGNERIWESSEVEEQIFEAIHAEVARIPFPVPHPVRVKISSVFSQTRTRVHFKVLISSKDYEGGPILHTEMMTIVTDARAVQN